MHGRQVAVDQAGAIELAQDAHDATGAVHVFKMDIRDRRRHLAKHRDAARQPVDILHPEGDAAFIGGGQ